MHKCTHLQDLVELFLVFHHDNVGIAVLSNVVAGLRTIGGVDSSRHTTVERDEGGWGVGRGEWGVGRSREEKEK